MTVTEIIDEILPGEGESPDNPAPERTPFRVSDESSACWVLRRLAAIEAEAALVKAQAARRVEELAADRSRLLLRFSPELEAWAREEAQRRRRRSVTLLWGTLAFRSVPARLEVCDPSAAADVALTLGLVKPASADLTAYKKRAEEALRETGELLLPAFRSWASALIRADSMAPDRWIQALMTPAALVLITASSAIISVAVMLTAYNHLQLRALSRRS